MLVQEPAHSFPYYCCRCCSCCCYRTNNSERSSGYTPASCGMFVILDTNQKQKRHSLVVWSERRYSYAMIITKKSCCIGDRKEHEQ